MVGMEIQKALETIDPDYNSRLDHRVICADGETGYVNVNIRIEKDANGRTIRTYGVNQDITERKRAEESLRLFRTLLDKSNDAIEVIDMETGQFIDVNERACTDLGYSRSELLNMKVFDIDPNQSPESFYSSIRNLQSDSLIVETLHKSKDGRTFPVEVNLAVVKLEKIYTIAIVRDITERKRITDALEMAKEYAENLIETANAIVIGLDVDGNINVFNKAAEEITGYTRSELLGQDWFETMVPKQLYPQVWVEFEKLSVSGFPKKFENPIRTKSGEERYIVWQNNNITGKGNVLGTISFGIDITQRRKSEESLQKSQQILEGIINTIPVRVFWKDTNLVYLGCNKIFANDAGFNDPKKIIGKDDFQLGWKDQAELYRNDDLIILESGISRFLIEEPQTTPEGKTITLLTSKIPLRGFNGEILGILGTYIDITERKKAEEEIIMLAHSLESVNECVSITDLNDKIQFVNESYLRTYGYQKEELIGKKITIVRSSNNSPELINKILPATKLGGWSGELLNRRKDGSEFPIHLSTTMISDKAGKPLGLIGVATDITERRLFEKELIDAKNKAEESDRLKSAFLANMSHEIRTPMNGILGFTELLKKPQLTGEKQLYYIDIIEKSGTRMLSIINDIISISKVEAGQTEIIISDVNVNEQVQYIYNFFRPEAEQKKLQLFFKNSLPENEAIISTDREKVIAVLTNLVKNAIKFTDTGSIEFGYNKKGNYLEFYVKDTGIGIRPEQKELIFTRFRQGSESLTRNFEGSGLGLSISKAYVEMLGGKIWMERNSDLQLPTVNREEKGSTFYFTLPNSITPNLKTDETNVLPDEATENQTGKLKILIAEDDEISEILIDITVEEISKEVIKVNTGLKAVEACRNNPDIDVVLMDIKMPEMDGYEATGEIRKFNKKVIIIAQTAYGLTGDRKMAMEAGCNDYISKPVNKDLLIKMINMHLNPV